MEDKRIVGDINLAAAYIGYGAILERIDSTDKNRQKFIFIKPPKEIFYLDSHTVIRVENPTFEAVEIKYVNRQLMFPPDFIGAMRRAKDAIYSR